MGAVFFVLLFWPLIFAVGLVFVLFEVASAIILSPAFIALIASLVCDVLAVADLGHLAWLWYHDGKRFNVKAKVVRPVILVVVGFVALVVGLVLAALVVRGLFVS
ncbi:hypothetical protein [Olsenella uli]|uniref:hypothetical protein n=1 Tax=Olsenella uli TaxID=133926 RepID=UPI0024A855FE|nr:hypothetical protein [Olsenella uli]